MPGLSNNCGTGWRQTNGNLERAQYLVSFICATSFRNALDIPASEEPYNIANNVPCSVQKVAVLRSEFRIKRLLNTALCLFASVLHCMQSYTGRHCFLSRSKLTNSLLYGTDSFNNSCFLDLLKSGIYCLKKLYLIHPTCYLRHDYVVLAFCDCLLLVTTASVAFLVLACACQSSILSNCCVIL